MIRKSVLSIVIVLGIFFQLDEINGDDSLSSYTTRYNYVDVNKILANDRLLEAALNCIFNGTVCTTEGKTLRRLIPDAIRTGCAKCSEIHKYHAIEVVEFFMTKKPDIWQRLLMKYDPEGLNRRRWARVIEKTGLHL